MTAWRSEESLVGAIALILVPLLAVRIVRGLRDGRMPLYRTALRREDNEAKFFVLIALNAAFMVGMALIGLDLLFNVRLWEIL